MPQILFQTDVAPSIPAIGKLSLYAKADGKLYIKNDQNEESSIATGRIKKINIANMFWSAR